MDLEKVIRDQLGRGMIVGRKKDTDEPFKAWHRDLGHCWGLILSEAVTCTEAVYKGDKEKIKQLDTLAKLLMLIYSRAVADNKEGLAIFPQLYDYIEKDKAQEVYATLSAFVVQSIYCYLFTSVEMALGLEDLRASFNFNTALMILSCLDDETRPGVIKQMSRAQLIPAGVNYLDLLNRLEDFVKVIEADRERIKNKK